MLKDGDFTGNSQVAQSLVSQTIPIPPFVKPVLGPDESHPASSVNRARFRPGSPLVGLESALTSALNHRNLALPMQILGELPAKAQSGTVIPQA
jgi:hypothetical protein